VSKRAQRRHRGRPPNRRPAGIPDRSVTAGAQSPGTTAAHGCRLIACVCGPARPTGQTVQDGAQASIAALGCSRAFPSRCALRSVTHCGPTLSRSPARATRSSS
jgi:hypothetical protein